MVQEQKQLADWYRDNQARNLLQNAKNVRRCVRNSNTMKPDTSVPILRELASEKRRRTFHFPVRVSGQGHEVHEGVPAVFPRFHHSGALINRRLLQWLVQ
ncbi:MAG: hypothetical protein U0936_02705 [Planctomycetaceae bacterium]